MGVIVLKFGGTSVADTNRIRAAAEKALAEHKRGNDVVVVVSAMAGVTNRLIAYCQDFMPDARGAAYDSVLASGEQATSGLMALALQSMGLKSRDFQGWQIPIETDSLFSQARIAALDPAKLKECIAQGIIPVISGFQGMTPDHRITTLGRGGSDTTAVAVAAALKAERCDIYTDVNAVYTTDPRLVAEAAPIPRITYEEMLEMAALGAKVLHPRAVELAMQYGLKLQVLSSFEPEIGSDLKGTLIGPEDEIWKKQSSQA